MATNMLARKGRHCGVRNLGITEAAAQPMPMMEICALNSQLLDIGKDLGSLVPFPFIPPITYINRPDRRKSVSRNRPRQPTSEDLIPKEVLTHHPQVPPPQRPIPLTKEPVPQTWHETPPYQPHNPHVIPSIRPPRPPL